MAHAFLARMILIAVSLSILLPVSFIIDKPLSVQILIWLVAGAMVLTTLAGAFTSVISGYERFRLFGGLALMTQSLNTLSGLAVLAAGLGLIGIGGAQLGSALISSIVIAVVVNFRLARFAVNWSLARAMPIIKAAAPLGITALLTMIYYRASFIFLSHFHGDIEVGYYNSSYALINSLLLLPTTFSMTVLPRMSEYAEKDSERLDRLYQQAFKYLFYFGFSAAAGIAMLAGPIFDLLYPDSYSPGISTLQILVWALAMMFVTSLQGTHLVARNKKKQLLGVVFAATVTNVVLNIILIPSMGKHGAAIVAVISEFVSLIGGFICLRRHLNVGTLAGWILRLAPSIGAMIILLRLSEGWPLVIRVAAGAFIVFGMLLVLGGFSKDDFMTLSRLWKNDRRS